VVQAAAALAKAALAKVAAQAKVAASRKSRPAKAVSLVGPGEGDAEAVLAEVALVGEAPAALALVATDHEANAPAARAAEALAPNATTLVRGATVHGKRRHRPKPQMPAS
jgi:hypothetical protein